jgi:hypothetical protein
VSRRLLAVMLLPPLVGLLAAAIAGAVLGSDQFLFFLIAYGLCVPAGLIAVLIQERLIRSSPFGQVAALAAGTAIRLVACFGGGVVVYFLIRPEAKNDKLAFWIWILFAYLTALVVETAVFAKKRQPGV